MLSFRPVLRVAFALALALGLVVLVGLQGRSPNALTARGEPYTAPALELSASNPYRLEAALVPYARFYEARLRGDSEALLALAAEQGGSFLEERILHELAAHAALTDDARVGVYRRLNEIAVRDPLALSDERRLWLDYARAAEIAGLEDEALGAFARALPLDEAKGGVARLAATPDRRAQVLMEARLFEEALTALGDDDAPLLRAPLLRALGRHEEALDAYRRWIEAHPDDEQARHGEAMSLFDLGRNAEADARFAALPGARALAYRGHIARRAGDAARATTLFRRAGDAASLWALTEDLEAEGRLREAVALYLELSLMDGAHADDAAYRAYVLAERQGDAKAQAAARARIPQNSYFALLVGETPEVPHSTALPPSGHPALEVAQALARAGDFEAAIGELRFAAREASDEASAVDLAEALYNLGDFRQSYLAVSPWLARGSRDLRTWTLAYPRAYSELVTHHAARLNLDAHLVWAVMRQESRYYPRAVSRSNAQGLMQVIPSTWDWLADLKRETPADAFDPFDNIRYGSFYLGRLVEQFGGDLERAVAAYNGGPGYISRLFEAPPVEGNREDFLRFIDRQEPREYIQQVLLNYHIYRALYGG